MIGPGSAQLRQARALRVVTAIRAAARLFGAWRTAAWIQLYFECGDLPENVPATASLAFRAEGSLRHVVRFDRDATQTKRSYRRTVGPVVDDVGYVEHLAHVDDFKSVRIPRNISMGTRLPRPR